MMKVKLLAGLLFGTAAMAAQGIPPGLSVQYKDGKIGITAKDQSVRQILEDVSKKAGFEIVGADLLPEDRVTMVLDPSPVKFGHRGHPVARAEAQLRRRLRLGRGAPDREDHALPAREEPGS
ncbi:MAG: hypothetical protein U0166_05975 [Acidobacteriota bacterium]